MPCGIVGWCRPFRCEIDGWIFYGASRVTYPLEIGWIDNPNLHERRAFPHEAQLRRRGVGQIDDSFGIKGTAIVDSHHGPPIVFQVGYPRVAGQRQ